jgi:ATP-dependent RNA helicase DDX46/PRP5
MSKMTKEEVKELRTKLDGISCRGKKVPKPIKSWNQAGLSNKIMELIRRSGFENPMPIQAQALPIIMSGRDCIAVAKTGSGKTLAYILPMLRHIKDQPEIKNGDGPIANDCRTDERIGDANR